MTIFPSLVPSNRTFMPGEYPHSPFSSMSGVQNRVLHSTVVQKSQLRLSFAALTESEMLSLLSHYLDQQGSYLSFDLPDVVFNGLTSSDFTLTGYKWRYSASPEVEDYGNKRHSVTLTLESVPFEGSAVSGLEKALALSLSPGALSITASATGAELIVGADLIAGYPYGDLDITAIPLEKTINSTIDAGAPTADCFVSGIDLTLTSSFSGGAATEVITDPYFSSVVMLLHFEGANNSTTFTNNASNGITPYRSGSGIYISTSQYKFGSSSLYGNGGTSLLLTPTNDELIIGTADFTVEMWVRLANTTWAQNFFQIGSSSGSWNFYLTSGASYLYFGSAYAAYPVFSADVWYHLAVSRAAGVTRIFRNGSLISNEWSNTVNYTSNFYRIGVNYNGFIDDLRVTKGVGRYSSNFTPPSAPFPDS